MDKTITHIGKIEGKVLLFGGVYSNLQALEKLISIAAQEKIPPENCMCTGDIVGYCAQPEETVQLFRKWGAKSIQGNVEQQLIQGAEDCGCEFTSGSRCDGFSKLWYPYAQSRLSKPSIDWMGQLPNHIAFNYVSKNVLLVHGSFTTVSEFIFKSTPNAIKTENFQNTKSNMIVAGHSGLPFHKEINGKVWLNPGAIGMPANDGTRRVWYMVLNEREGKLIYTHRYFEYDYSMAHRLMKDNHLPMEYAETLLSGLWDNMEILPEAERKLQGIPYIFDSNSLIASDKKSKEVKIPIHKIKTQ